MTGLVRLWKLHEVAHRPDFAGLHGYEVALTTGASWVKTLLQIALLKVWQDGTFRSEFSKSHWDLTREGLCRNTVELQTLWSTGWRLVHSSLQPRLMRWWSLLPPCMRYHGLCRRILPMFLNMLLCKVSIDPTRWFKTKKQIQDRSQHGEM